MLVVGGCRLIDVMRRVQVTCTTRSSLRARRVPWAIFQLLSSQLTPFAFLFSP